MARPPRGTRRDSRGRSSRDRLQSIRSRRARRRFGESLFGQLGFGGSDFKSGGFVKGKLGLFTGPIGGSVSDSGSIPQLEIPEKEANKSNPSLSTVVDQLESLIKSANKLGTITKKQEKALLDRIKETQRVDRESLIESSKSDATALEPDGVSPQALAPLETSIEQLTNKLDELDSTLTDKLKEQNTGSSFVSSIMDQLGLGNEYDQRVRRRSASAARFKSPENQRRTRIEERNLRASKFDPELLKSKKGKTLTGDALTQRMNKLDREANVSGISRLFSFRKSSQTPDVRSSLSRTAGPLLSRIFGQPSIAKLTIVSAIAGLTSAFALNKLVGGDPIAAGLEPSSGLAGAFAVMPALTASIVKDSYFSVYGMQPEDDPDAPQRILELKAATETLIKDRLKTQLEVRKKPSSDEIDRALIPETPPLVADSNPKPESKPPIAQPPVAPPISPSPSSSQSETTRSKETSGTTSGALSSNQSQPELQPSLDLTGSQLIEETKKLDQIDSNDSEQILIPADTSVPIQATTATTRPGVAGMGDVRSPYYDVNQMGSIPDQVYY